MEIQEIASALDNEENEYILNLTTEKLIENNLTILKE